MADISAMDEIVCPCSGTTKAKILSLIEQGLDAEAISRRTGAISGCGGCEWDIAELLSAFISQQKSNS
jgi:NAD(P)H-nitrite reductase large subunit